MVEDASGTLWIAGHASALVVARAAGAGEGRRDRASVVTSLVQVPATGAVFAAAESGVYRIDSDTAVLVQPPLRAASRPSAVGGCRRDLDRRRTGCAPRRSTGLHPPGAPHRSSAALFDREGSLWLGTDAGGLHRLKPALFTTYSVPEGVGHPNVYATYVDRVRRDLARHVGERARAASIPSRVASRFSAAGTIPSPSIPSTRTRRARCGSAPGSATEAVYACTPPAMTCRAEGRRELR